MRAFSEERLAKLGHVEGGAGLRTQFRMLASKLLRPLQATRPHASHSQVGGIHPIAMRLGYGNRIS